jgi:hypothetical protein
MEEGSRAAHRWSAGCSCLLALEAEDRSDKATGGWGIVWSRLGNGGGTQPQFAGSRGRKTTTDN